MGVTTHTAVGCKWQYLECVGQLGYTPHFIQSDRGVETVLLADAHFQLQQATQSELEIKDCYMYGTSTANQRIESWWNMLSKGMIFCW